MNCPPQGMNYPNIIDNNKCYSNVATSPCYTQSCSNNGENLNCSGGCGNCGGNSTQGLNDMSEYTGVYNNCGCGSGMTAISTGLSAYQVAVLNGFVGSQEQWLQSLQQGQSITGTFPISILAGTSPLPILSSATFYNQSGNVVNWTANITVGTPPNVSGVITISGFPLSNLMASGSYPVNVEVLSGANTFISFVMTNGVATGYKDNIANVVPSGQALTPLEYSDLTFPVVMSLSGNYVVTGAN